MTFLFIWVVLKEYDPSEGEWKYVRKAIGKAIKSMNPRFLKQLNCEIRAINDSWNNLSLPDRIQVCLAWFWSMNFSVDYVQKTE